MPPFIKNGNKIKIDTIVITVLLLIPSEPNSVSNKILEPVNTYMLSQLKKCT